MGKQTMASCSHVLLQLSISVVYVCARRHEVSEKKWSTYVNECFPRKHYCVVWDITELADGTKASSSLRRFRSPFPWGCRSRQRNVWFVFCRINTVMYFIIGSSSIPFTFSNIIQTSFHPMLSSIHTVLTQQTVWCCVPCVYLHWIVFFVVVVVFFFPNLPDQFIVDLRTHVLKMSQSGSNK